MKLKSHSSTRRTLAAATTGFAALLAVAHAEDQPGRSLWQASFSADTMLNASVKFRGHPAAPVLTGAGDFSGAANYDNGYVGLDTSGSPTESTYWGYNDASQQIVSGSDVIGLNYERTTVAPGTASPGRDADAAVGGEFSLRRELIQREHWSGGLEFGFSYNSLRFRDASGYTAAGLRTGSSYSTDGGIDAGLFPAPGYTGSFDGIGTILNPTASPGGSSLVPGAVSITGNRSVDADLFGFRLGPYLQLELTKRFYATLAAGLAVAVVHDETSWTENISVSTASAQGYWTGSSSAAGSHTGVQVGMYAGLEAGYRLTDRLDLIAGARVQTLGTYSHALGAGQMELDLGSAVSFHLGLAWSF